MRHDRATLQRWLGVRAGAWLYDRMRGVAGAAVEPRTDAKPLSRDETFPTDIDEDVDLRRELLRLSDRAAMDLRTQGYRARTVTVRIRDHDFRDRQTSRTLPRGLTTDRAIAEVALGLLHRLRRARAVPARLVGIALSQLSRTDVPDQQDLFGDADGPADETYRDRRLSTALDELRGRVGSEAIGRANRSTSARRPLLQRQALRASRARQ